MLFAFLNVLIFAKDSAKAMSKTIGPFSMNQGSGTSVLVVILFFTDTLKVFFLSQFHLRFSFLK